MDAPSQRALALVLPVHIRPLVGLIAEFVGVSLLCEVCHEKGGLRIRFESGAWFEFCPECIAIMMSNCDNSAAQWLADQLLALFPQWREPIAYVAQ